MLSKTEIERQSWKYLRQSFSITAGLSLIALLLVRVWAMDFIVVPLIVSAAFSVLMDLLDVSVWRLIAKNSPESLTTFYAAISGFRMLLALATMCVYYVVTGGDAMIAFCVVFLCFYLVLLLHHAIFFSWVSNHQ